MFLLFCLDNISIHFFYNVFIKGNSRVKGDKSFIKSFYSWSWEIDFNFIKFFWKAGWSTFSFKPRSGKWEIGSVKKWWLQIHWEIMPPNKSKTEILSCITPNYGLHTHLNWHTPHKYIYLHQQTYTHNTPTYKNILTYRHTPVSENARIHWPTMSGPSNTLYSNTCNLPTVI